MTITSNPTVTHYTIHRHNTEIHKHAENDIKKLKTQTLKDSKNGHEMIKSQMMRI